MKQIKRLWLATIAALLCSLTASAHDFEVNGIYYNITSSTDMRVAVTYRGNGYHSYSNEYTGAVTIPETIAYNDKVYRVTSIGDEAFFGCSSLTSIAIPESVTSIGSGAFYDCSSLTSITIPEGVTSIGEFAFFSCSSLTSITIPESVTSIGGHAFESTAWYDNQPDGVIYVGNVLYEYKGTMPESTSIEVKEGTTAISPAAFAYCSSLTSITIPESVTSIGNNAFYNCTSLKEVIIEDGSTTLSLGYNDYYSSSTGRDLFYDCPLETVYLGRNLSYSSGKSYGYSPFYNRTKLTSVTIGESVTSIESYTFYDCSSLTSINIPEGVTSIESYAFSGCSNLTSISIPEGVTSIGSYAFSGCSSLTFINIPESVTEIEPSAFWGCDNIETIHCGNIGGWMLYRNSIRTELENANIYIDGKELTALTDIVIPSYVNSIPDYTFRDCSNLTSITIPESVTEIGEQAFTNCSSLASVAIPYSVTEIGDGAFENCVSLKNLVIEDGSTTLSLGYNRVDNSESGYYTSVGLFNDCPLENVYLGRNLTYSTSPFNDDDNTLVSVTIGDCVTEIQQSLFRNCCSSLKELTIGKGVRSIGAYAFTNGEALEKITIYATLPPSYDGNGNALFSDATYKDVTLYVPQGSTGKYQVMTGWSRFYNISEMEDGTPEYLTIRQADNGTVGIAVDLGRTYKVCITPSEGWRVHTVTFNGTDITAQLGEDNTLTTPTVTGSSELNVAYEQVGGSKVADALATAVKVSGYEGIITVDGCPEGENISIYTIAGALVAQEKAESAGTHIAVETEQLYVVQVASKVVKIRM